MKWLRVKWHEFQHWLGSSKGEVVSMMMDNEVYIGFRCIDCGKIDGVHRSGLGRDSAPGTVAAAGGKLQHLAADEVRVNVVDITPGTKDERPTASIGVDLLVEGKVVYRHRIVSVDPGDCVVTKTTVRFNS